MVAGLNKKQTKQLRKDATKYRKEHPEMQKLQDEAEETSKEIERAEEKQELEKYKEKIREAYYKTIEVLKEFMDMENDYFYLISIWGIGTYLHEEFRTYPYIFINAMRGTAKTRLLNIIKSISKDGDMLNSLTEAVLFRSKGTLCIDEFENLGKKGKGELRELLNSAYKKGTRVKRMKKKKMPDPETGRINEEQVVEAFDVYRPIAIANIWGMEEVLGDRCIHLTLERSNKPEITKKQENFEDNEKIKHILSLFSVGSVGLTQCRLWLKELYKNWNIYIQNKYKDKNIPYTIHNTHKPTLTYTNLDSFFNKIDEIGIQGRDLELFFPLFIVSSLIDDIALKKMLKIAKKTIKEKKVEEQTESKDVMVIDFVSQQTYTDYVEIRELKEQFKEFIQFESDKKRIDWLSSEWFGKALRRLSLTKAKRRLSRGIEVILDIQKAQKKIKMFKPPEK